ncbi:MAG: calcium-translocating P-type ATPase, PMCA-type [Gemmataceae bacterium]|nr:calcium-translocating P-type ATPase, PMCA-type [Gemmataceae bacterium]MCI0740667.1 calcium-translocating P-type ATPase, PMCA-type [Gemmataceae bacterium]
MRTIAEIQNQLSVSTEQGLGADQAQKSKQQYGANVLTPLPREPIWKKFLEKFDEPIIKILLAAALLSMVVDLFKASNIVGGICLGVFAVVLAGAYVLGQARWVPSLLFVSALLMFFVGLASGHILVEGLAVMVAVILATGVAFISEYRSDREFELLNAKKDSLNVKVQREGNVHSIALEDVVVGDVIILEMGDEIPADGRLLKATELFIDQSLMTGESEPVRKTARPADDTADGPDQPGCLYRGTQVVDGIGLMMVADVGDATYLGQIARRLSADVEEEEEVEAAGADTQEKRVQRKLTISKEQTPLQQKLTNLADLISKVGYIAAILIFLAQLLRGIIVGEIFWPGAKLGFGPDLLVVFSELLGYFVTMVIIIVVAVPEGLPMSVTVSLALAMRKMTRANSLVRQLVACETIGSATVICSDKTGTLTQNKMQVDRIALEDKSYDRDTPDWVKPESHLPWPRDGKPLDWMALNAAVNSTANLEEKQGKFVTIGNSTEGALLQWLQEAGIEYTQLRLQFPEIYQIHFSSERKRMTTVTRYGAKLVVLVKGAPEWVLEQCQSYHLADGSTRALSADMRERIHGQLREAASRAMRTLAFAHAVLPDNTPEAEDDLHDMREALEMNLVFSGFVAIRDPLRGDVKDAIAECRSAGIEVKMITGDNVETARAIGYEIGLVGKRDEPIDEPDAAILTSKRFNELNEEELKAQLPKLRILARARPLDKFRMVKALQELGEVVAVTGDGTNDAPALKKADVGLAMGIAGTEVAKEASKIVLLDDAFSTIVKAVHWGRSLYENIQRFIQFQLTINVSALTITFLGILLFSVKAPFTVLQLLWINVIMDTFASIALCSEPPREGVMKMPPKRRDENILSPAMVKNIFITASFFVVVMLALLVAMKGEPGDAGLLAGQSPWSAEAAGNRFEIPQNDPGLAKSAEGKWTYGGQDVSIAFTVLQVSLFFSIYVFFQVWNQINCRSLTPETSGFHRIWENPTFLTIAGAVAVGQIVIVTFGGTVFKVESLGLVHWIGVIAFTSTVLIFAEVARRIRLNLQKG